MANYALASRSGLKGVRGCGCRDKAQQKKSLSREGSVPYNLEDGSARRPHLHGWDEVLPVHPSEGTSKSLQRG